MYQVKSLGIGGEESIKFFDSFVSAIKHFRQADIFNPSLIVIYGDGKKRFCREYR